MHATRSQLRTAVGCMLALGIGAQVACQKGDSGPAGSPQHGSSTGAAMDDARPEGSPPGIETPAVPRDDGDSARADSPADGAGAVDEDAAPMQGGRCERGDGKVSEPGRYEGYSEARYPDHQRSSFYVEVRDGTRLAMDLFRPVDEDGQRVETPLPVLWMHTPYNRRTFTTGPTAETYPGFALRLVPHGYVVAVVDFRGLYASFGQNVAFNRGEWVEPARMDAYDITEWLAAQPFSNGKVGMWGCSATGGSQLQAATTAPPHLRAIFPMSCEFDVYPFAVPGGMAPEAGDTRASPRTISAAVRDRAAVAVDGADGAALLRQAIASHEGSLESAGHVPFRDSVSAAVGEPWWIISSPHTHLEALDESGVALYLAANWNEGATKHGAFFTFNNVSAPAKLLVGPAGHCEWSAVKDDTGFDLVIEELRFFDYWLKDVPNCLLNEPPVYYYTYGADGDGWRAAERWPLPEERRTRYYLGPESLSQSAPTVADGADSAQAAEGAELVFTSEALGDPLTVTGHPQAELWVSSTATDGDFIVSLQDVAPDGTATSYFVEGRLRASHRAIADAPYDALGLPYHAFTEDGQQPLVVGEPTRLDFELLPISIRFAAGHRIRVIVRFVDAATPTSASAPTVTIHRSAEHPSAIVLPVVEG